MNKILNIIQAIVILGLLGFFIIHQPENVKTTARSSLEPVQEEEKHHLFSQHPQKFHTFDVPENLTLAGEKVPLDDVEVLQRLDRELHVNTYWNSNTIFLMKRSSQWFPQIQKFLRKIRYLRIFCISP